MSNIGNILTVSENVLVKAENFNEGEGYGLY